MSVEAITWALSQSVKHSTSKFVLVVLANCADGQEFIAWPSVSYLSECTGQDRKTVLENLKRLCVAGLIEDTGERKGSTKQVIVYRLKGAENGIVKWGQKRNSTENGTVPVFLGNSPVFPAEQSRFSVETVPKTGHGTINEPSIEPIQRKKSACALPCPDDVDAQTWADWLQLRKDKKATVSTTVVSEARKEANKAGLTFERFLSVWCVRGSQGLSADWLKPNERAGGKTPTNTHKYAAAAHTIFGNDADELRTFDA